MATCMDTALLLPPVSPPLVLGPPPPADPPPPHDESSRARVRKIDASTNPRRFNCFLSPRAVSRIFNTIRIDEKRRMVNPRSKMIVKKRRGMLDADEIVEG